MTTHEEASPYAPPQTNTLVIELGFLDSQKASRGRRLANIILDLVTYLLIVVVTASILYGTAPELLETGAFDLVVGYPAYLAYYVLFEGLTGRTPGKFITGTCVVDAQGRTPGFGKVILRTLARYIPFEAFSFFRTCPEGWHDTLTKTHVIIKHPPKETP